MTRLALFALVTSLAAAALAACDTPAQPAPAAAAGAGPSGRLSAEHESCGATTHCEGDLRCFAQVCQRPDRSVLGDYQAAVAARRREAGDLTGALDAYVEALKGYEADKLAVPADVDCAYGSALAAARADRERAELAARVLHRCVNSTPAASPLRAAALREIALLDEVGLDPAHVARPQAADLYLTRAPARPKSESLAVTVAAEPPPTAKGWPDVQAAIASARPALVACWEAQYAATKATTLAVTMPMRAKYKVDPLYPDDGGKWVTGIDGKPEAAAGEADRCVQTAVTAAIKGVKPNGEWAANVTVTVK